MSGAYVFKQPNHAGIENRHLRAATPCASFQVRGRQPRMIQVEMVRICWAALGL